MTDELKALLARIDEAKQSRKPSSSTVDTLTRYQKWYTQGLTVVRQLMPDRYAEFQEQYIQPKKQPLTVNSYTISDYYHGILPYSMDPEGRLSRYYSRMRTQIGILESGNTRIDSILADIRGSLQAEMFDDELDAARDLLKNGHIRASGAVAGVSLERHLKVVASNHEVKITTRDPGISNLNDALKNLGLYDVPDWRFIQRLGDLRNLCSHAKDKDPTKDDAEELIQGVSKILKTIN
jgi:hypothetical protein